MFGSMNIEVSNVAASKDVTERIFDDLYEYVDLWAGGYIRAYLPDAEESVFQAAKYRLTDSILKRIEVINELRKSIGLNKFSVDDAYDYYINNMPEYNEQGDTIDLTSYDEATLELEQKKDLFKAYETPTAKAFLIVMGAPDYFINNSDIVQERIDHINRLLKEGGYAEMTPKKT